MVPEIRSTADKNFFVNLDRFLIFYLPVDPENQNFEKIKKALADIIILQMCTKNDHHMMYGSQDMECNRQSFLPFYPPNNLNNQNFEKMKKASGDIITLHRCTINDNHTMYGS